MGLPVVVGSPLGDITIRRGFHMNRIILYFLCFNCVNSKSYRYGIFVGVNPGFIFYLIALT